MLMMLELVAVITPLAIATVCVAVEDPRVIVPVPAEAPRVMVCAVAGVTVRAPTNVLLDVPDVEPNVIAVVEPDAPFVPIPIVAVLPDPVVPPARYVDCDAVELPK
jgi:hypothetical protein